MNVNKSCTISANCNTTVTSWYVISVIRCYNVKVKGQHVDTKFPGRAVTIRKFVQEQQSVQWLVHELVPNVGWTLLIGKKGVGKTTFAIQMCVALQEGSTFLGRACMQRNVLFVQCDSVENEWRAILERVAPTSTGYTMVNVPSFALDTPTYVSGMASLIAQVKPGYIVYDSLYKLSRKPVNSERVTDTLELLSLLSAGVPWLLIHHPPHEESRAAGHHSIGATCSNEWHLLRNKLLIDKGRLVKDKEILLQRDEDGLWEVKADDTVRQSSSIYDTPLL